MSNQEPQRIQDGIPTSISPGLQREFVSAVERTGWTPELRKAAVRIPALLRMSPEEFEQFSAKLYLETE